MPGLGLGPPHINAGIGGRMSGRRNVMVSAIGSLALGVVLLVPVSGAGGAPGARLALGTGSGASSSDPFGDLDAGSSEGQPEGVSKPDRSGLADLALREVVEAVLAGSPVDRETAIVRGDLVRVEVVAGRGGDAVAAARAIGARVRGHVGDLALADVPADRMMDLERSPGVQYVRLPQSANLPEPDAGDVDGVDAAPADSTATARGGMGQLGGEAVVKTGIDAWQAYGYTGQGIKVGIIDSFSGTAWNASVAAGELAGNPAGAWCYRYGAGCGATFWNGGTHGVAVAEVVSDMAPSATIYLGYATTATDVRAVVDQFAANGVRIITRSLTGIYDGPGNGTGPMADVIAYAESRGIAWFNSAGNSAGGPSKIGSYFRSGWVDSDADGWMNFPGGSEFLPFNCYFINGLRWSDWGANRTDYDLYVYEEASGSPVAYSINDQQAGFPPLETFADGSACVGQDVDYIAVNMFQAGNGPTGDILEFMVNGSGVASWSNPFSVTQPAGDVGSGGAAVIGAIEPVYGTTIAEYSSQGPTNDGRTKPDLSAASNMTNLAGGGHFNGTSAATPVAAGAAAVLLGANPGWSAAQLVSVVRGQVVDRGVAGADNVYGTGELWVASPVPPVSAPSQVRGLKVRGSVYSARRKVSWTAPTSTGGAPILSYVVAVYHGKKLLLERVVGGGKHGLAIKARQLRNGKNTVFVAAFNGSAYGAWLGKGFRVRR